MRGPASDTTAGIDAGDDTADDILRIEGISKAFPVTSPLVKRVIGRLQAVDRVSLSVGRGECVALVGESGSGKTTLGRMVVRALDPSAGSIRFRQAGDDDWADLAQLRGAALKRARRQFQMIFQDPYSSLDPRMTVFEAVREPLRSHGIGDTAEQRRRVTAALERVGLGARHLDRYPHAFSGGQRQRIGIARALVTEPQLIVADEAVSALDVSVQAQILNLLMDLQDELGLSYLFIAHDLAVVEHLAQRVAVMYAGKLVELAPKDELFATPAHPYTEALLSAMPLPEVNRERERIVLSGETANPADLPTGCVFHPRCRYAVERCRTEVPEWREIRPGHRVACHRSGEIELQGVGAERVQLGLPDLPPRRDAGTAGASR